MKYQSELIKEIVESRGHEMSSTHYESECVESWIEETKGAYPKLCDYQSEWLNYISEKPIGIFPYEIITDITEATVNNVVPYEYKSAILKGQTLVNISSLSGEITIKPNSTQFIESSLIHQNKTFTFMFNCTSVPSTGFIEIRQILDNNALKIESINVVQGYNKFKVKTVDKEVNKFRIKNESTSNTDFVFNNLMIIEGDYTNVDIPYFEGMKSVQMPVLTTSNEDGTKTNILTVNEDVTLRSNGSVYDELDLLTGKLTQRIDEDGSVLTQEVVKTVDLSIQDQDGNTLRKIKPIEGTMYIHSDGTPLKPTITMEIPVEATAQNLASFIKEE